jgi:hypothetical protein
MKEQDGAFQVSRMILSTIRGNGKRHLVIVLEPSKEMAFVC